MLSTLPDDLPVPPLGNIGVKKTYIMILFVENDITASLHLA